jgi:hypothetical protein
VLRSARDADALHQRIEARIATEAFGERGEKLVSHQESRVAFSNPSKAVSDFT